MRIGKMIAHEAEAATGTTKKLLGATGTLASSR